MFKLNMYQIERIVLFASALLLIVPGTVTDLAGFAVLAGIFFLKITGEKKTPSAAE